MKLIHIDYARLTISPLNVRKHGADEVDNLVQSIRVMGVLQPLLVREVDGRFEVVAGQRRYRAYGILVSEGMIEPLPCAVMEDGDDAAAIEASLAENIERLPMDELDQYAAFAGLIAKGRSVEDIAGHFGVTERLVRQRLALANLDKRILLLYRRDEIGAETLRSLTMATKGQQKAWLKRLRDPDDYAPQGRALRQWLLGGQQIATSTALFEVNAYKGGIVADLFGEDSYFADPEEFWTLQKRAVDERIARYRANGWTDVLVVPDFPHWDYAKTAKRDGGKVYVTTAPNGEVAFHEGHLPHKDLRKGKTTDKEAQPMPRPELTKAAQNYVDLHRHAAVQANLISHAGTALRLVAAHMIARSSLWQVKPDAGRAAKPEFTASVMSGSAKAAVEAEREAVLDLLGYGDADSESPLVDHSFHGRDIADVFAKLQNLSDDETMRVLAYAMAETLDAQSPLIDMLGVVMGASLVSVWQADEALLGSIASKETLLAMLADIGGTVAVDAHKASTAKVIRSVILQYASGEGRPKVEGWVPPYLQFPAGAYLDVSAHHEVEDIAEAA